MLKISMMPYAATDEIDAPMMLNLGINFMLRTKLTIKAKPGEYTVIKGIPIDAK